MILFCGMLKVIMSAVSRPYAAYPMKLKVEKRSARIIMACRKIAGKCEGCCMAYWIGRTKPMPSKLKTAQPKNTGSSSQLNATIPGATPLVPICTKEQ